MKTVLRYPLPRPVAGLSEILTVIMPEQRKVLGVSSDYGKPYIRAEVDTGSKNEEVHVVWIREGHPFPGDADSVFHFVHLGSTVPVDEWLHLYEVVEFPKPQDKAVEQGGTP